MSTEIDHLIKLFVSFLDKVGIEVKEGPVESDTFLPGLEINRGVLIYDRNTLLHPGDILHEAGHIAVTVASQRSLLLGNVMDEQPDKAGEEMAAMLWSYAACIELGIAPEIVFHKDGYKGEGAWLLENYANKIFIGLPLLIWMGMTAKESELNGFPRMSKWLRD
ncbi:MAG: hypothetical protein K2P84_03370 [Undibacterium sp.]|nr:hypothetical protein [Undibacterium sp.]